MLEPLADRSLAGRLAGPVDAERPERIVLRVGPRLGAIEHVVGGKVEERASDRGRRLGQTGGAVGIDGECRLRFRFGPVDGGVAGSVDNQRRPAAVDHASDRAPISEIEIAVAKPDPRYARGQPRRHQLAADLPAASDDQNGRSIRAHPVATTLRPSRRPS